MEVTDADSGTQLLRATFHVEPNGKSVTGSIPQVRQPSLWLIRWSISGGGAFLNHYLAGDRPFQLDQYRRWLKLLQIPEDIGSVWQR
jgi:hypothetical protein